MPQPMHWQKSSFSDGSDGDTCVELAATQATLYLRESDTPGTELSTSTAPLTHLIRGIKSGQFLNPE